MNVSDLIGNNGKGEFLTYQSGYYTVTGTDQRGSLVFNNATNTVSINPNKVTIPGKGGQLIMRVTTSVPAGALPGQYCDVATYTSANAGTDSVRACVNIASSVSARINITDLSDPITAGNPNGTLITALASIEPNSNQGATNHTFQLNFGATDPADVTDSGRFNFSNVEVYYDPRPIRDSQTGLITSDHLNSSSQNITSSNLITINYGDDGIGKLAIVAPNFVLEPGGAVFIRAKVVAPAGTPERVYQEVFRWEAVGAEDGEVIVGQTAEPTSVVKN